MAQPKPKWSLKKKLLIGFGVVLLIPLVIILILLIIYLINTARHDHQTHSAKPKVTAAKQKAEPAADKTAARFETDLTNSGIVTSKVASSKVDSCYLDHQDAGWTVHNWYQACYLRYVGGFTTSLSRDQVKQTYTGSGTLKSDFGNLSNLDKFYPDTCALTDSWGQGPKLIYLPAGASEKTSYDCVIPDQFRSIGTPTGLDKNYNAYHAYQTFNTASVSRAQNQIWFEYQTQYYQEDLGCGGILCDSPRSKPVMAP